MEKYWRRRERQEKTRKLSNEFERVGGGGGSRSAAVCKFSNVFENTKGSIGKKRRKAAVQVQNRYSGSAVVNFHSW